MDVEHYKKLLLAKERELTDEAALFGEEARDSRSAEVEDPIDTVTSDEAKAVNLQMEDLATRTLQQVRAALQRIQDGTYGICSDCGRRIDPARLEAVPWTLYCREDQEKHDRGEALAADDLGQIA